MDRWTQAALRTGALLGLVMVSGCAPGLGGWGDVLGGAGLPGSGEVRGEVRYVDTRDRTLEVRSGWGRSTRVEYDSRTRVIHGQRRYSVSSLERGDVVSMRVRRGRHGDLYADRIYLERDVRERRGRYPDDRDHPRDRLQTFSGRVAYVDRNRGGFELEGNRRGTYWVTLPRNPSSSTRDRLRRLRRGDRVRFEGQRVGEDRIELYRFR